MTATILTDRHSNILTIDGATANFNGIAFNNKIQQCSTNGYYISIGGKTISFGGVTELQKTAIDYYNENRQKNSNRVTTANGTRVKTTKHYDNIEEFLTADADASTLVRCYNSTLEEYTKSVNEKIKLLEIEKNTLCDFWNSVHKLTEEEYSNKLQSMYDQNEIAVQKAILSSNSKSELVDIAKQQADEIEMLKKQLELALAK